MRARIGHELRHVVCKLHAITEHTRVPERLVRFVSRLAGLLRARLRLSRRRSESLRAFMHGLRRRYVRPWDAHVHGRNELHGAIDCVHGFVLRRSLHRPEQSEDLRRRRHDDVWHVLRSDRRRIPMLHGRSRSARHFASAGRRHRRWLSLWQDPEHVPVMSNRILSFQFIASALLVAIAAHMAWHDPKYLPPLLIIGALALAPTFFARRRVRRILMSGDVDQVLGTWQSSMHRLRHPETMTPLMMATAYASCGWIAQARRALERAVKGPAWDAAIEQRLFIETLLDTFEGDRSAALEKAASLQSLPVPRAAGKIARSRIVRMRRAMTAVARAFAHQPSKGDLAVLRAASKSSPLIHWATRYAAAIIAVDRGDVLAARSLIANAPPWPEESAFRSFDEELRARTDTR